MKIIYIHKAFYDKRPPIISTVENIINLQHTLVLVTSGIKKSTHDYLINRGVVVYDLGEVPKSKIKKVFYYLNFKKRLKQLVNQYSDYLIWIGSLDAAIAIGKMLLKYKYILQIQELYDKKPFYLRLLKKFIRNSTVNVVPDNARALIFRSWYNLSVTPVVLPNKPFLNVMSRNQNVLSNVNAKKLTKIIEKKIILYQATMIRMDTSDIAEALLDLGDEYVLGLFGGIRDIQLVQNMLNKYPNVVHFEHMFAPDHLTLTSNAWIGVLTYNYESLNNVFCAPNKTWEFAAFGIPMLANNLPVLRLQLEKFNAGEYYEFGDIDSIKTAIKKISENYQIYSDGAKRLFNSIDTKKIISDILIKANEN